MSRCFIFCTLCKEGKLKLKVSTIEVCKCCNLDKCQIEVFSANRQKKNALNFSSPELIDIITLDQKSSNCQKHSQRSFI